MSRQKRTSRLLEKAELRASGLQAIDPSIDFGDERSLQNLKQIIEQLRNRINSYNTALAVVDSSKTEMEELEKILGDLMDKMLIGVAFKYGNNSREYEMAGGVRKSERIRRSSTSRLKGAAEKSSETQTTQS